MHIDIYVEGEPGGRWMGHALAEVGCIWRAATREDAVAKAPQAISEFCRWLHRHGEPGVVVPAGVTVTVADTREIENFNHSGATVGLFAPDHGPVTDAEIATVVRRLGYARQDLMDLVWGLPPEALDWAPEGRRTIRKNLTHLRNCHGWYLTRVLGWAAVQQVLPEPWPAETFESCRWVLERAVDVLLHLPAERRSGIYRAERPDEDWTPRKMLRRFVEHEREHVEVVAETIKLWREAVGDF